ncbi:ABC transporter permease [Oerskovia sp. NPDC057915]|uniref:ABC transporter permease n=1 Tax=Oerskovia sp. NPDC057915 TaxID=3346280 RepID=UPI0036D8B7CC
MSRYLLTRVGTLLLSLVLASVVVFAVLRFLPGDSAGTSLGVGTTSDQLDQLRADLGTDQPLWTQYGQWVAGLFSGSAGTSFVSRLPVGELIASKLPITLPLSLAAFAVSVLVSVPLGVVAAVRRRGVVGVTVSAVSQLGVAVPVFWVGVILVWVFALEAGVLPPGGFPRQGWEDPAAAVRSLVLPVATVAIAMSSVMVRYVRSATLDVLDQDYVRTARSLGYGRWHALARHGLRNGAVPVVAILGIELATSLLGAVVVENVFALPGLGTLLVSSVAGRDLPVVQALVLGLTALVLVTNFLVDLAQRGIDPRLRAGSALGGAR